MLSLFCCRVPHYRLQQIPTSCSIFLSVCIFTAANIRSRINCINCGFDPLNIHLKALGCRLNEAELENWATQFQQAGHQLVNDARDADLTVLNTCAVTREAVRKSRKLINRVRRESPYGKLVVSGCAVSTGEAGNATDLGIDMLIANNRKNELVETVLDTLPINIMPEGATLPAESALFARNRQRAFVKIQDGCRYRCSYCIVTKARGEEKSRSCSEIIEQINHLSEEGVQEVVLTGVHVGGYGSDINSSLTNLVKEILNSTSIPSCLLYTSDAADEGLGVDLGGRRII